MGAKERNKNYVLEKAKEVFLERGITGVSMADIAKEADFGVASVYRYFGNRNASRRAVTTPVERRILS